MPARREAKDVYDALEQVRVEVVGSRHMAGVAANLRAEAGRGVRGRRLRPHDAQGPVADRRRRCPCWRASRCPARQSPAGGAAHPRPVARHAGRHGRRRAGRDDRSAGRPDGLRPRRAQAAGGAGSGGGRGRGRTRGPDRGRRGRRRAVRRSRTTQQDGSRAERVRAGQHARRPARGDGRRGGRRRGHRIRTRKPRSPRATTGPAARSRAASGRTRTTRRSIAPTRACTTRRSTPRICATRTS